MVLRYQCKMRQDVFLLEQFKLSQLLPNSWHLIANTSHFQQIEQKLTGNFLPPKERIFKALELSPAEIKIVILGQDPYPNKEHAMGLAFSVKPEVTILPASLQNIYQELKNDLGIIRQSGDLSDWSQQGVLLLNMSLTVEEGVSGSHLNIGWEAFTQSITAYLGERDCIGILWGKRAQQMNQFFKTENLIQSPHPSPLSSYRGFFGSKPFSRANSLLERKGFLPIKW